MNEWFHARDGRQTGPVGWDELRQMARHGALSPADLVWNNSMADWQPAGKVEGLFDARHSAADSSAPMPSAQAPVDALPPLPSSPSPHRLPDIAPGSDPIRPVDCVKHAFTLTKRHFGTILLAGLAYFGATLGAHMLLAAADSALGLEPLGGDARNDSAASMIISQIISVYLTLGMIRFGLNLVSGEPASAGQVFSQGHRLLPAIAASILFGLMVFAGLLLLVVPGIYLMLRYGQFMNAIVDRNMGVIESLSYSSAITRNNRMNLLGLALLSLAIIIAGFLALVVGLIFAYPVVWLGWMTAYRWMQSGQQVVRDQQGTA